MTFPPVSAYSSMRTDGREFRNPDRTLDLYRIEQQARYDTVVLELASMRENPDIVAALRAANPGIKLIAYVVMKINPAWGGAFFTDLWRALKDLEGFLYNVDGNWWRDSNINTARPEVVDAVARVIAKYLIGGDASAAGAVPIRSGRHSAVAGDASAQTRIQYNGLFLDVFCARVDNATASGIDWRRAGSTSEAAFQQAWMLGHAALVEKVRGFVGAAWMDTPNRDAIGPGGSQQAMATAEPLSGRPRESVSSPTTHEFPIVGNCGPSSHADVNGWCRENFPEDRGWYGNMVEYVTPAFTVPGVLHETYREPRMSWLVTRDGATEAERQRRGRFALGSACLRDGVLMSYERREGDAAWCDGNRYILLKEYSVTPRGASDKKMEHKGWLGEAIRPAMEREDRVWCRDFEHGMVFVNPTSTAVAIRLTERLRAIDGVWKKAWIVPPMDSLFLVRT